VPISYLDFVACAANYVAREFALNFYKTKTKVGTLELEVSEATIAAANEIPNTGERWFKSMNLNVAFSKDFLKP
jgi:hypothetical protein